MQKVLYRDYDALAYNPKHVGEERGAFNYIKKTKQRQKGVEIVFDPKAHKDFVTGFRKRKQQRRKDAEKQILKKSKAQRLEDRAQRRKELKHNLGLPDDYGVQDSDTEQGPGPAVAAVDSSKADVKHYQQGQYVTTVAVINMNADSDEEQQQQQQSAGGSDAEPHQQRQQQVKQQQQQQQQRQQRQRHQGKHKSSGVARTKSHLQTGSGSSEARVKKASTATKSHQKKKRKR